MSDKEALEKLRDLRYQAKLKLEEFEQTLERLRAKHQKETITLGESIFHLKSEISMWDRLINNLKEIGG